MLETGSAGKPLSDGVAPDSADAVPLVECRSVSVRFGSGTDSAGEALRDVNLSFEPGSFTTIIGPSGCGKSTLLKIVAGLITPTAGSAYFEGAPVVSPPFECIYVFQEYSKSLFPWKSVIENVAFPLRCRKTFGRGEAIEEARRYLDLVGLAGRETSYPWQLSGGMQQRVAIARGLACRPRVLLMDEPFSSLDALSRSSLQDLTLSLWRDLGGLTVIFVTHDIEEAVYLSKRVVVLSRSPGRPVLDINIDIPYPRSQLETREQDDFLGFRRDLLKKVSAESSRL